MKKKSSNPYKKPPVTPYDAYVPHPRYGRGPRLTGLEVDLCDANVVMRGVSGSSSFPRFFEWSADWPVSKKQALTAAMELVKSTSAGLARKGIDGRIAGTTLVADQAKLRPVGYGKRATHYCDLDRQCRRCKRRFIFFAAEQKYWYEELRFPDYAEAWECVECRKALDEILELRKRYEELVKTRARTEAQTMELVECAVTLIEAGVFSPKGIPRLRGFLNRIDRNPAEGSPLQEAKGRLRRLGAGLRVNQCEGLQ